MTPLSPLALQLRPSRTASATAAWFVPGSAPQFWLDEVEHMQLPWAQLSLLPVADREGAVLGALLLVASAADGTSFSPQRLGRAQPFAQRADAVYLPVEAELFPPVSDDELRELAGDRVLLFHPSAGLVAFDAAQRVDPLQLLSVPPVTVSDWSRAHVGVAPIGALREVLPLLPPDLLQLFGEERRTIGQESPSRLPPVPGERRLPRDPSQLGAPLRGLARLVLRLTKNVSRTASRETWLDRLEAWAHRRLVTAARIDQLKRDREIDRLLRLLDDDPARGLRFALPLGGDAGRGEAFGGNWLQERRADFDARALGGGRAVDAWNVPADKQRLLQDRYRQLAAAEAAAGRHRRAAYIYGQLLGDLRSAAATLADGGFHREAARLYRERLRDPEAAARCLVRAGLLVEAAKLEEELGNHQRAGDLRLMLGEVDVARAHYEQAVRSLETGGDHTGAALLIAERLQDVPRAIALLRDRTRSAPDKRALAALLGLCQRVGDERELAAAIEHAPSFLFGIKGFAEALASFAQRPAAAAWRPAIEDRLRRLVAELGTADPGARQARDAALSALLATTRHDTLLRHDVRRARARLIESKPAAIVSRGGPIRHKVVGTRLVRGEAWDLCAPGDEGLLLGCSIALPARLTLLPWRDGSPDLPRERPAEIGRLLAIHADRSRGGFWIGSRPPRDEAHPRWWPLDAQGQPHDRLASLGRNTTEAFDVAVDGTLWSVRTDGTTFLSHERNDGTPISTHALTDEFFDQGEGGITLRVVDGRAALVYDRLLGVHHGSDKWQFRLLPDVAIAAVRSEEDSNPWLLVALEQGLCAIDLRTPGAEPRRLAETLRRPTVGWTRGGIAVAIDNRALWTAPIVDEGVRDPEPQPWHRGQPFAIVPVPDVGTVALVYRQTVTFLHLRR